MTQLRAATTSDANRVARLIREVDRAECLASHGIPPEMILPLSVEEGNGLHIAMVNDAGEAFGLFGVNAHPTLDMGLVWMVSTDEIYRYKRQLLRRCRPILDRLHSCHALLGNRVDKRNITHIRWIRWLGFSFLREIPDYGPERRPFLEFAKLKV